MNRTQRSSKKPRGGNRGKTNQNKPPQLTATVNVRRTFRFISSSGTAKNIQDLDMLNLAGVVGRVAGTSVSALGYAAKLHSVKVWTPPASQGATATCRLQWTSDIGGTNQGPEVSDITMSVTTPAYISAVPPPGSFASFWVGNAGTILFTLSAPSGSVIDIDATVIMRDDGNAQTALPVATATIGAVYWLALDYSSGNHSFTPDPSLPTTF